MQYVRNLSDSVSTAWNSINPATLSGAIDVIVVEQEDGTLACSPFHVRFGKFSLLRPHEKKVEFKVNGVPQMFPMKLGEGGEAFFVFGTTDAIPQSMQTSPLVTPVSSPRLEAQRLSSSLQQLDAFDLNDPGAKPRSSSFHRPPPTALYGSSLRDGLVTPRSTSPDLSANRPSSAQWPPLRPYGDEMLRQSVRPTSSDRDLNDGAIYSGSPGSWNRSSSPPPLAPPEALQRARILANKLSEVDIPTHINEQADLMLDMSALKNNDEDAFRIEILARNALLEELDGNYDIGALIGLDEQGNIWIYSREEAKKASMAIMKRTGDFALQSAPSLALDAISDPGYHSDGTETSSASPILPVHGRTESAVGQTPLQTPPSSPGSPAEEPSSFNFAKTLRLTSDQLKSLQLQPGENSMSFTVNRATCSAFMYLWKHETPVVISDIDGTITKSDALGHVLNMIGRDWTHTGVAKLYCDIVANGYNIMYLTSRSVGQADTTRAYLHGILQEGSRLPRGPTILSPDRTMAALRREIYLRKPHVFKMSTLRDIRNLYGPDQSPFYAGFGNRFTDQISYRTVDVPRNRIFTINSNSEVSLDLLSLNKLKLSYVNMTEVVDHYFPPVSTMVKGGGEEYTDFKYWRDAPLDLSAFSDSESESEQMGSAPALGDADDADSPCVEDEGEAHMGDSYISRYSMDDSGEESLVSGSYDGEDQMMGSMEDDEENADDGEDSGELVRVANEQRQRQAPQAKPPIDELKSLNQAGTPRAKRHLSSPRVAVQDRNAEMITGIKNLSLERDQVN